MKHLFPCIFQRSLSPRNAKCIYRIKRGKHKLKGKNIKVKIKIFLSKAFSRLRECCLHTLGKKKPRGEVIVWVDSLSQLVQKERVR